MPSRYSSGKYSIAQCDRCDERFMLKDLKKEIIKTRLFNLKVCPECWDPDQPQLQLGMYPVDDPQALRNPRRDTTYLQAGLTGLQILTVNPPDPTAAISFGDPSGGSRVIQWGWAPVGLNNPLQLSGLTNNLLGQGQIGTVTITTS
jgi:hypothetical protein